MTGLLLRVLGLTSVYLLVLTSVAPGDVLIGLLLSTAIVAAVRRVPLPAEGPARSPRASLAPRLGGVPALLGGTSVDLARGTWHTARCCLVGRLPGPGLVPVPLTERPPAAASSAAAWAVRVGLAPDSLVVELDERRGRMLLHVLDARDPDAVRAAQRSSYERRQRRVFP